MGKPDDISSTEKLLEMIRLNQSAQVMESAVPEQAQKIPSEVTTVHGVKLSPVINAAPVVNPTPVAAKNNRPKKSKSVLQFLPGGKPALVGIDLQATGIALVLVAPAGAKPAPLKSRFIPYDLATSLPEAGLLPALLAADWLPAFLKKALDDFRAPNRKTAYWCALPRDAVQTHNTTIPKVPDQEVGNTVFWTTVREIAFDQAAMLLDFQTVKEIKGDSGSKILTIVYLAARREIEGLTELFNSIGHPLTGIASPAAAFHNELRQSGLAEKVEHVAHLFLGDEKSYIALFSEGSLIFRRDINTGISSLVESLMEKAADQGVILDEAGCRQLLFSDQTASSMPDNFQGLLTEDQTIFDLELPAAVRLIRQMERTLDYCKNNFAVPRASRIMLDGVSFSSSALAAYFSHEIGIECQGHKPLAAAGAVDDHRLLTAFGIAMSDLALTQNFLQTHEQKAETRQIGRINKAIVAGTMVVLLACGTFFLMQRVQINAKEKQLATLADTLGQQTSAADSQEATDRLLESLERIKDGQKDIITQARRFFPVAVTGKLIGNLPRNIILTTLALEPGEQDPAMAAAPAEDVNPTVSVPDVTIKIAMHGIVTGPRQNMEFELARYLRAITTGSFMQSARVTGKETSQYQRQEVLRFKVEVIATLLAAEPREITD
jgi:Tfp pilus assembly PilM family ATPase